MKTFVYWLLIVPVLVACQPNPATLQPFTATPRPSMATPEPLTATPVATLTPTQDVVLGPLGCDFKLYTDEPVLPMGQLGTWDSGLMDPGAVVFHDNAFHMFYDSVPSFPSLLSVGYATSSDGLTWTRTVTEPIFTREDIPWQPAPGNLRANSVIVDGDTWVLYFSASDGLGMLTGVIGRATAPSPTGPWTVDAEPALKPGEGKDWDAGDIGHVEVIRSDEGYVMYYSGALGIGMAISPDGIEWTKYDDPSTTIPVFAKSDPVLNKPGVEDPNVQKTSSGWGMVYRYKYELVYAESFDGIHWTDVPGNPIVTFLDKEIFYSGFVVHEGMAFLYFEAGGADTSIYMATWKDVPSH